VPILVRPRRERRTTVSLNRPLSSRPAVLASISTSASSYNPVRIVAVEPTGSFGKKIGSSVRTSPIR